MMQLTEEQKASLIEGEVTYSRLFEALKGLYEVEDDDAVWEIFNQTDDPLEDVVCALKLLTTKPAVAAPAVPDGWRLVPIEPTEAMIIEGFESEPDEGFSDSDEWEKYQAMSGCEQAAHRARLCYAAMLAAAPSPSDSV